MKSYTVIHQKDHKSEITSCLENMLPLSIQTFLKNDEDCLIITAVKPSTDPVQMEKDNYKESIFELYNKKYQEHEINNYVFFRIVEILDKIDAETQTREEFEKKFEEYKKTLNIR